MHSAFLGYEELAAMNADSEYVVTNDHLDHYKAFITAIYKSILTL